MTASVTTEPAWTRYADEPEALMSLYWLNVESMKRDPVNAQWYREQNAEIEAHLRRREV